MYFPRNRRDFLKTIGIGAAAIAVPGGRAAAQGDQPKPAQTAIPRWRGFNLLNFFQAFDRGESSDCMVKEDDCRWIRDWGFDFIRLPMDYWLWVDSDWRIDPQAPPRRRAEDQGEHSGEGRPGGGPGEEIRSAREPQLPPRPRLLHQQSRARAVRPLERQAGRGCVRPPLGRFAKRYKGVSAKDVSFNLVNEAAGPRKGYMSREDYRRVMTRATEKIRQTSPDRLVIIDGLSVGNEVVTEMIPTRVAQSVHAYTPAEISHFRASWVDRKGTFPEPSWPLKNKDGSIRLGPCPPGEDLRPVGGAGPQGDRRPLRRGRQLQPHATRDLPGMA